MACSHAWYVLQSWLLVPCSQVRTQSLMCLVKPVGQPAAWSTAAYKLESFVLLSCLQQTTHPSSSLVSTAGRPGVKPC